MNLRHKVRLQQTAKTCTTLPSTNEHLNRLTGSLESRSGYHHCCAKQHGEPSPETVSHVRREWIRRERSNVLGMTLDKEDKNVYLAHLDCAKEPQLRKSLMRPSSSTNGEQLPLNLTGNRNPSPTASRTADHLIESCVNLLLHERNVNGLIILPVPIVCLSHDR